MVNVITNVVKVSSLYELLAEIKKSLTQCKDTQIYFYKELYLRLLEENNDNLIWKEDVLNSFYYRDNIEKAVMFYIKKHGKIKTIHMHLIKENLEYLHLTFFASNGVLYRHYNVGMDKILIICSD